MSKKDRRNWKKSVLEKSSYKLKKKQKRLVLQKKKESKRNALLLKKLPNVLDSNRKRQRLSLKNLGQRRKSDNSKSYSDKNKRRKKQPHF